MAVDEDAVAIADRFDLDLRRLAVAAPEGDGDDREVDGDREREGQRDGARQRGREQGKAPPQGSVLAS
ncbi:MAG TPA: hypothetical protein VI759_10135 [Dehalococcoidia bacterium]|nr:hypothetical protein [Dehalococcoidia bacterium]